MRPIFPQAESEGGPSLSLADRWRSVCLPPETLTREQQVTQLFLTLREPLYRYLVAAFGHPAEAEEITQEAFLRFYRALRQGREIENARAWLFRTAHNLALDGQRGRKFLQPLDEEAWRSLSEARRDARPTPEQHVLEQEKFARLQRALERLSPQELQCLHLRAEGFRYREIGEILGISQWTVVEFLRRGIRKLSKDAHG